MTAMLVGGATTAAASSTGPIGSLHLTGASPSYVVPSYLVARQGTVISGKAGLTDTWTQLASNAADVQASGTRIAYRDSGGSVYAKDGLTGTWYTQLGGVDQYVIS